MNLFIEEELEVKVTLRYEDMGLILTACTPGLADQIWQAMRVSDEGVWLRSDDEAEFRLLQRSFREGRSQGHSAA